MDTDVTASIEYAIDHLSTKLIVVMGRTSCGAASARVDHLSDFDGEQAEVVDLLYRIEPAIAGIDTKQSREKQIQQAVHQNVEQSVRRLSPFPDLRKSLKGGSVRIVGAIDDMHTEDSEIGKP
ncbi:MAG: carbonic anhydrase [Verrucomicrobiota bacterium]|nr:carbonic anhydrase [Verrucomicrobiota bacterium]